MPHLFLIQQHEGWKRKSLTQSYCQMKNKTPVFEKKWWYSFFFPLFFDWPWEKTSSNSISPKSRRCGLHSTASGQHGAYPTAGQWDLHGSAEIYYSLNVDTGFLGGAHGKDGTCQTRRHERCRFTSLKREDPLEKGMATTPLFLPENPMDRGARLAPLSDVTEVTEHTRWIWEYVLPGSFMAKL